MSGFESPNYTQAPNDFFAMLPTMQEAEMRVTLIMIRQTFGFHREGFKMGLGKLATAAGLSRAGALTGAQQAEYRGTFRRTNPDTITEAEWELVTLQPVEVTLQPVEGDPLAGRGQVGVKESIKKDSKEPFSSNSKPTARIDRTPEEQNALDEKKILSALPQSQDDIDAIKHRDEIANHYEQEMGYNPLQWWTDKKLMRLLRFLVTKTPAEITTFANWSKREYSPLSPTQARKNPDLVTECWPQAFPTETSYTNKPPTDGKGFYA